MKFFTADCHFGERPNNKLWRDEFSSREEHNEAILDGINSKVCRNDYLYILGDFAWDKPGKYRQQIRCKNITFIIGNHDRYQKSLNVFGTVHQLKVVKFAGTKAVLCHYPFAFWDGSHKGWFHFYGHCHMQREETLDTIWPKRRSMDVGVDNAKHYLGHYEPFSEEEILGLIGGEPGHDQVDFYKRLRHARVR